MTTKRAASSRPVVVLVAVLLPTLGCHRSNPAVPAGGPAVPASASAYCHGLLDTVATRLSGCESGTLELWQRTLIGSSVDRPLAVLDCDGLDRAGARITFDGAAAAACLAAAAKMSCEQVAVARRTGRPFVDSVPGCLGLVSAAPVTGTVASGGDCYESWDCAGGYCDRDAGCPGRCAPYLDDGVACMFDSTCRPGRICVSSCTVPRPSTTLGEPCTTVPDNCAYGLYCARINVPICATRYSGGNCSYSEECLAHELCRNGTCAPMQPAGAACTGGDCEPGLDCVGGTCATSGHPGQACLPAGQSPPCIEGWCQGGSCQAWSGQWQSCTYLSECEPLSSCSGAPPYPGASQYCARNCHEPDPSAPPPPDMADPCGGRGRAGAVCHQDGDCCSGACGPSDCEAVRLCWTPPTQCRTAGAGCTSNSQCCSGTCGSSPICSLASACK